jgi:hypothetical protein
MANVTDTTIVRFANEQTRIYAECHTRVYYKSVGMLDEWNALDMAAVVPNDDSPVIDGSAEDGRPIITGADIHGAIASATVLVGDMQANNNANLNDLLRIAVRSGE